nr:hypothetical protein [Orrella marina]
MDELPVSVWVVVSAATEATGEANAMISKAAAACLPSKLGSMVELIML